MLPHTARNIFSIARRLIACSASRVAESCARARRQATIRDITLTLSLSPSFPPLPPPSYKMSSGTIKITVNSASITTSSSSFFLEINACNQSFVTSIVRNEKWHQFEETFEVEYDSDLHESGGSVAVKVRVKGSEAFNAENGDT